jgi:hypothetical protein
MAKALLEDLEYHFKKDRETDKIEEFYNLNIEQLAEPINT